MLNPPRARLMAQFKGDPIIEIARAATPGGYIHEHERIMIVAEFGPDWRHWVEAPMPDHHAWGRNVIMLPKKVVADDSDLQIEVTQVEDPNTRTWPDSAV